MWGDTHIPLAQFIEFLTIHGKDGFGIQRDTFDPNTSIGELACSDCCCLLEFPYQNPTHLSRQALEDALRMAEEVVIEYANLFPNRVQIEDEVHDFYGYEPYRPRRPVDNVEYGLFTLEHQDEVTLTWDVNLEAQPDTVEIEFDIVTDGDLDLSKIRLFFSEDDFPYREIEYNSHYGEIRPYKKISHTTEELTEGEFTHHVTIVLDTYLLNHPDNFELEECCRHVLGETVCFIDTIDIYLEVKECCVSELVYENGVYDCKEDCDESRCCVCVYTKKVQGEHWFAPRRKADCDCKVDVLSNPNSISINYLTGILPSNLKRANRAISYVVFMLALGLGECFGECKCAVCYNKKVKHYQNADEYQIRKAVDNGGEYDVVMEIIKDKFDYDLAKGLPLNKGVLTAMFLLSRMKKDSVGVMYL